MKKFKARKDRYFSSRGGVYVLVKVYCASCNAYILTYQKDGHGALIRLYLDRIVEPEVSFRLLRCNQCNELLAVPMIYKKEGREALRINRGKVRTIKQV
jgi:hypothetical protein